MKSTFILFLGLAIVSCGPSEKERVEAAEKEVFAVHDSLMNRMGDLLKTKKQLRQHIARLDSMTGSTTETVQTEEQKAEAKRLYQHVDDAEMGMMNWMDNYKSDTLAALPTADALRYLAAEKTKINDVNVKINTSLAQSRAFLAH